MPEVRIGRFRMPDSPNASEINKICSSLSADGMLPRKILITSCREQEGSEYIAMNLLRALADQGMYAILVEADLRHSQLQAEFDIRVQQPETGKYTGLDGYLAGRRGIDGILCKTSMPNADMILTGTAARPLRLLNGERFGKLMNALAEKYDVILVLAPSMEDAADVMKLASCCDGTLLVVRSGWVRSPELIRAAEQMEKPGKLVIGTVLSRFEEQKHNGLHLLIAKVMKRFRISETI